MRTYVPFALAACLFAAACQETMAVRGPRDEYVAATTPEALVIHRGESAPLRVEIDRVNFTGPVKVSIAQLPRGVDADRSSMTVDTTSATFALKAKRDADLVSNQAVAVTIAAMDGRKAMQYVNLTVTD
jgi:hypothetical protein